MMRGQPPKYFFLEPPLDWSCSLWSWSCSCNYRLAYITVSLTETSVNYELCDWTTLNSISMRLFVVYTHMVTTDMIEAIAHSFTVASSSSEQAAEADNKENNQQNTVINKNNKSTADDRLRPRRRILTNSTKQYSFPGVKPVPPPGELLLNIASCLILAHWPHGYGPTWFTGKMCNFTVEFLKMCQISRTIHGRSYKWREAVSLQNNIIRKQAGWPSVVGRK